MRLESKDATCVSFLCEPANSHGTRDFAGDTDLQAPFCYEHCAAPILKAEHYIADRFCVTFCGSVQVFGL